MAEPFASVQLVAAQLPFHLDETDKANAAFMQWHETKDPKAKRTVDLWTYCFIRRYYLAKAAKDKAMRTTDVEELVEKVYARVEKSRGTIRDAARYASWTSVVCRNMFLNYIRRRRDMVSVDEGLVHTLEADSFETHYEAMLLIQTLIAAIGRLPGFLQQVARFRLVEQWSYEDISKALDKPIPNIRSYVNKACKRLRQDPYLVTFFDRYAPP